jgi:hypothetical protein
MGNTRRVRRLVLRTIIFGRFKAGVSVLVRPYRTLP